VNPVPDLNKATAIAATGRTKAGAGVRVKLLSRGFSIDHPDPELGEQLMADALGVADRDAMHGILKQLVKASVNGGKPDAVNLAFMISMVAHSSRIPWTPGGKQRHERSRPQCRSDAGQPALRRKNPLRRIVPLTGGARQKALPHARRCAGIRRAKGNQNARRHGRFAGDAIAERKQIQALLGEARKLLQTMK
jgi:hypothetical protein